MKPPVAGDSQISDDTFFQSLRSFLDLGFLGAASGPLDFSPRIPELPPRKNDRLGNMGTSGIHPPKVGDTPPGGYLDAPFSRMGASHIREFGPKEVESIPRLLGRLD